MKDYSVLSDLHTCQWAQLVTAYDKGYEQGYMEGQKHDLEHTENIVRSHEKCKSVLEAEYQRGLKDAWNVAKKIGGIDSHGTYNWKELHEIFNIGSSTIIFEEFSISEALEKIQKYENEKNIDRYCNNCKYNDNGMFGGIERCEMCSYDERIDGNSLFEAKEGDGE